MKDFIKVTIFMAVIHSFAYGESYNLEARDTMKERIGVYKGGFTDHVKVKEFRISAPIYGAEAWLTIADNDGSVVSMTRLIPIKDLETKSQYYRFHLSEDYFSKSTLSGGIHYRGGGTTWNYSILKLVQIAKKRKTYYSSLYSTIKPNKTLHTNP